MCLTFCPIALSPDFSTLYLLLLHLHFARDGQWSFGIPLLFSPTYPNPIAFLLVLVRTLLVTKNRNTSNWLEQQKEVVTNISERSRAMSSSFRHEWIQELMKPWQEFVSCVSVSTFHPWVVKVIVHCSRLYPTSLAIPGEREFLFSKCPSKSRKVHYIGLNLLYTVKTPMWYLLAEPQIRAYPMDWGH